MLETPINPLTPNGDYSGRTAPLTSKRFILYIYSTNIGTEYFKHGIHSPFFPLQNAVCFIILTCLVPVLFTFYTQGVLKLKKNSSGAKRLVMQSEVYKPFFFLNTCTLFTSGRKQKRRRKRYVCLYGDWLLVPRLLQALSVSPHCRVRWSVL